MQKKGKKSYVGEMAGIEGCYIGEHLSNKQPGFAQTK